MEHDEPLDIAWVPESLSDIFEDSHADTAGQWETLAQPQDSYAA